MEGGNHVAYQSVEEMKNVDPRTVDRSQLVDRAHVRLASAPVSGDGR